MKINPAMILHGEQETEVIRPLPTSGNFFGYGKVLNVYDKGKGALFEMEMAIKDATCVFALLPVKELSLDLLIQWTSLHP